MSPLPIIARQRALSRVGEIRTGGEKPERGAGKKLDKFRLTSQQRDIIDRCGELYGGTVSAWQSPAGDAWQLYTDTPALPVYVIRGHSLQQGYELWEGAAKCSRRCDGEEEQLSGGPCICNAEGSDKCSIITRLMVVLPETGTSLGWQLRSTGEAAARELSGAMMLLEEVAQGRSFVPATLRLTQRRSVVDGQVVRFVVPVLDFDLPSLVQPAVLPPVAGELPSGYTPIRSIDPGVQLKDGLEIVEAQQPTRNARSAAPIPAAGDLEFGGPVPVPDGDQPLDDGKVTTEQKKALNALHGELERVGAITTDQVYAAVATLRSVDVDEMIVILDGRKQDGSLSFAKLRDSLTKTEGSNLIDRLGRLADNVKAGAAA